MKLSDVQPQEYSQNNVRYLEKLPQDAELIKSFKDDFSAVLELYQSMPSDKLDYRYAEGKWSLKEVFQHIIDTERIFIYRCFRIARHDKTPLSGFDQDDYIWPSQADKKSLEALMEEFKAVRESSIVLLNSLNDANLKFIGIVNGNPLSARAAAFNIIGHNKWHIDIIMERYL
ncbi:DinB family protein [Confluentibacter flavum]|uniref:DinB family protein n=1 Tax=Confluentibacter flavum TaxID=1909700 RepID=A0A2N3HNS0_9FLAO|nr:DinB family protein [Confluentibacter flavum]PKQ46504.1 DinB family protein [Confluentibacter flavum]